MREVTLVGRRRSGRGSRNHSGGLSLVSYGAEDEVLKSMTTSLGPYIAAGVCSWVALNTDEVFGGTHEIGSNVTYFYQ